MKIIGHRGAAGVAAENSLTAIRAARIMGVDAIEIDIRATKDNHLVVFHDKTLRRMAGRSGTIKNMTAKELSNIKLKNGTTIPSLEEVFEAAQDTPLFIEGKDNSWAKLLNKHLDKYNYTSSLTVISFNKDELAKFAKLRPDIKLYYIRFLNGLSAINVAKKNNFSGISTTYLALNPIIYALARLNKLDINVFKRTVPRKSTFKLLTRLYPKLSLTTNYPDQLINMSK